MTGANIIGIANFFVKSRKLSIVLLGAQMGYLIVKSMKHSKKTSKNKSVSK